MNTDGFWRIREIVIAREYGEVSEKSRTDRLPNKIGLVLEVKTQAD